MVRNKFRIIFQNICITYPLCSREHALSILESIAASPVVAGRAFSLREGVRVHTFAKSPTSVCVRRCNYPAGIRVSKVHSSKWLCLFQVSNRYGWSILLKNIVSLEVYTKLSSCIVYACTSSYIQVPARVVSVKRTQLEIDMSVLGHNSLNIHFWTVSLSNFRTASRSLTQKSKKNW